MIDHKLLKLIWDVGGLTCQFLLQLSCCYIYRYSDNNSHFGFLNGTSSILFNFWFYSAIIVQRNATLDILWFFLYSILHLKTKGTNIIEKNVIVIAISLNPQIPKFVVLGQPVFKKIRRFQLCLHFVYTMCSQMQFTRENNRYYIYNEVIFYKKNCLSKN